MYWLKRWFIWIYRWRHCRGFGVQSPSDYSFIRYVVNEHYPYYAYDDLASKYPDLTHILRKKSELLFRIANWIQSPSALIFSQHYVYKEYVSAGCHKTSVRLQSDYSCESIGQLTIASAASTPEDKFMFLVSHLQDGQVLVVDDIDTNQGRKLWRSAISNETATISFDLYYMGIVMNVDNRYKHDYIVNF